MKCILSFLTHQGRILKPMIHFAWIRSVLARKISHDLRDQLFYYSLQLDTLHSVIRNMGWKMTQQSIWLNI